MLALICLILVLAAIASALFGRYRAACGLLCFTIVIGLASTLL